jgi:hypothetical protein
VDASSFFVWIFGCFARSQASNLYEEGNNVEEYKYHSQAPGFDLENGGRRGEVVHDPTHHHVRVPINRLVS